MRLTGRVGDRLSLRVALVAVVVLAALAFVSAGYLLHGDDWRSSCALHHQVADPSNDWWDDVDVTETYRYDSLSDDAQRVVERAVTDGGYSTQDLSLNSPEFLYTDTGSRYLVVYQNETYGLTTSTGSGCEIE